MKSITTNRRQLAKAFEQWLQDYQANPETFDPIESLRTDKPKSYGESCAGHLIKRLTNKS